MTARERFASLCASKVADLVSEIEICTSSRPKTEARSIAMLRNRAVLAARSLEYGDLLPGQVAQAVLEAAELHCEAGRKQPTMRRSDARLGRAIAEYRDAELKLAVSTFPRGLPEAARWELASFRENMVSDLLQAVYILPGEAHLYRVEWVWTPRGIEAAEAPSPPPADEEGPLPTRLDTLFRDG